MLYVGDLSSQDVQILACQCRTAATILEFGSGGSTQIFAQSAPNDSEIVSVETDSTWIDRTQAALSTLGVSERVQFVTWEQWNDIADISKPKYDMIFVDGIIDLRLAFALKAWHLLKIGGAMIFHDTRRLGEMRNVLKLCDENFLSVDEIKMNIRASNSTVVTKKIEEPYQDWNVVEQRAPWMVGMTSSEDAVANIRELRARGL